MSAGPSGARFEKEKGKDKDKDRKGQRNHRFRWLSSVNPPWKRGSASVRPCRQLGPCGQILALRKLAELLCGLIPDDPCHDKGKSARYCRGEKDTMHAKQGGQDKETKKRKDNCAESHDDYGLLWLIHSS